MQIYVELFYNNIESLLASALPVSKRLLGSERWHDLVRDFVHRHASTSPYFPEISQEFLTFLAQANLPGLPPFLLELCHYEWVELGLSIAEEDIPEDGIDREGDLLARVPVLSPLLMRLAYRFPVHRIGPGFQPERPGAEPTQLLVYRRRDDSVRFMEVNSLTMALLDGLESGNVCGAEALARLAAQIPGLDPAVARRRGLEILERLRQAEIVLGTQAQSGEVDS